MKRTTLELILKGKDRGAAATLDKMEGQMTEVEQSTSTMAGAVKMAGTALQGFATIETAKAVWQLGEFGAETKRTENAFISISGGATQAAANLEAMQEATRGAMSETEAMANANRLLQMGLASNSEELATLTQMATRLGGAMGMDATQAMDDFAQLLANKSLPRLDQFGMASGKVRDRYNELKKTMGDDEAFKLAVMEQGQAALERLGKAAEDDQLAFERLSASLQDFKKVVAQELSPATSDLAAGLGGGVRRMTGYLEVVQDAGYSIFDLADTQKAATIITQSYTGELEELAQSQERVAIASDLADGQMADYAEMNRHMSQEAAATAGVLISESQALDLASTSAAEARKATDAYTARMTAMAEAHGMTAKSALDEAQAQETARKARLKSAEATGTLAAKLKDATQKQIASSLIDMLDPKKMGADAYGEAIGEIGKAYGVMDGKSIALAENLPDLAGAIEDMEIPLEDTGEALGFLIDDAEDGHVSMSKLMDEFAKAPDINIARQAIQDMRAPMEKFGGKAGVAASNMSSFAGSIDTTQEGLRNLVGGSPYTVEVIAESSGPIGDGDGGDNDPGNIPEGASLANASSDASSGLTVNIGTIEVATQSMQGLDVEDMAYRVSEVLAQRMRSAVM